MVFTFLVLLWMAVPAAAATPTPTPTAKPAAPPPPGRAVNAGVLNDLVEQSHPFDFDGTEPSTSLTIGDANLEAGPDFKIAKLDMIAALYQNTAPFLTPLSVKQKTVSQEANLYISGRATYCKYEPKKTVVKEVSDKPYKTEVIPELSDLDQATRQIAPMLTRYSISKNEKDEYDFRREPLELAGAPPCDADGQGTTQKDKPVALVEGYGGLVGWFVTLWRSIVGGGGDVRSTLSSKELTPYAESMNCLITGCAGGAGVDYLNNPKEEERVAQSGGIAKTYAPITHDVTNGEINGEQQNTFGSGKSINVKTHTTATKAIENATDYMKCAILPKSMRSKFGLSSECKRTAAEKADCNSKYFNELYVSRPATDSPGATGDPGYTIPYRNAACTIPQSAISGIAAFAASWGSGGDKAVSAVTSQWKNIQDMSKKYKWNPLFVMALWIEESGAGATANAGWHLGCLYGAKQDGSWVSMPKIAEGLTVCDDMACLFAYPNQNPSDFARFMCSYNTTVQVNGACPSYPNWEFADQVFVVYSRLLEITGTPAGCGFTEVHR